MIPRSSKKNPHFLQKLTNREINGNFVRQGKCNCQSLTASKLFNTIPTRCTYQLSHVIDLPGNHVFMGSTRCGQFLLTYSLTGGSQLGRIHGAHLGGRGRYQLHWWLFRPDAALPAAKVAEVQLFADYPLQNILTIGIAQWPSVDDKLVVYGFCSNAEDYTEEEHRRYYLTITTLPSLNDCIECKNVAASFDEEDMAANWDTCVSLSCMQHGLTIHTLFDVIPPHPAFDYNISLKLNNTIVFNTVNFLHVLSFDFEQPKLDDKPPTPRQTIVTEQIRHRVGQTMNLKYPNDYALPYDSKAIKAAENVFAKHVLKQAHILPPLSTQASRSSPIFHSKEKSSRQWCIRIPNLAMKPVSIRTRVWRRSIIDQAEKVYAFEETEDGGCEPKLKWYRRKRLADKMYEFCSDEDDDNSEDMENIRPPEDKNGAKVPRYKWSLTPPKKTPPPQKGITGGGDFEGREGHSRLETSPFAKKVLNFSGNNEMRNFKQTSADCCKRLKSYKTDDGGETPREIRVRSEVETPREIRARTEVETPRTEMVRVGVEKDAISNTKSNELCGGSSGERYRKDLIKSFSNKIFTSREGFRSSDTEDCDKFRCCKDSSSSTSESSSKNVVYSEDMEIVAGNTSSNRIPISDKFANSDNCCNNMDETQMSSNGDELSSNEEKRSKKVEETKVDDYSNEISTSEQFSSSDRFSENGEKKMCAEFMDSDKFGNIMENTQTSTNKMSTDEEFSSKTMDIPVTIQIPPIDSSTCIGNESVEKSLLVTKEEKDLTGNIFVIKKDVFDEQFLEDNKLVDQLFESSETSSKDLKRVFDDSEACSKVLGSCATIIPTSMDDKVIESEPRSTNIESPVTIHIPRQNFPLCVTEGTSVEKSSLLSKEESNVFVLPAAVAGDKRLVSDGCSQDTSSSSSKVLDNLISGINQDVRAIIADWEADSISSMSPQSEFSSSVSIATCNSPKLFDYGLDSSNTERHLTIQKFLEIPPRLGVSSSKVPLTPRIHHHQHHYHHHHHHNRMSSSNLTSVNEFGGWQLMKSTSKNALLCSPPQYPPIKLRALQPHNRRSNFSGSRKQLSSSPTATPSCFLDKEDELKRKARGGSNASKDSGGGDSKSEEENILARRLIPDCSVQLDRRYIEVDEEMISTITDIEDDDQAIGFHCALPLHVHGSAYAQMQMVSNHKVGKLNVPCLLVRQNSLDIEQLCSKAAEVICKCEGFKFWFCDDYDTEIVEVCPLDGSILIVVFMRLNVERELPPNNVQRNMQRKLPAVQRALSEEREFPSGNLVDRRHFYECKCLFIWNADSQECSLETFTHLTAVSSVERLPSNWSPAWIEAQRLRRRAEAGFFRIRPVPAIRAFVHRLYDDDDNQTDPVFEIQDPTNLMAFRLYPINSAIKLSSIQVAVL